MMSLRRSERTTRWLGGEEGGTAGHHRWWALWRVMLHVFEAVVLVQRLSRVHSAVWSKSEVDTTHAVAAHSTHSAWLQNVFHGIQTQNQTPANLHGDCRRTFGKVPRVTSLRACLLLLHLFASWVACRQSFQTDRTDSSCRCHQVQTWLLRSSWTLPQPSPYCQDFYQGATWVLLSCTYRDAGEDYRHCRWNMREYTNAFLISSSVASLEIPRTS